MNHKDVMGSINNESRSRNNGRKFPNKKKTTPKNRNEDRPDCLIIRIS